MITLRQGDRRDGEILPDVELPLNPPIEVRRFSVLVVEESCALRRVEFPGGSWVLELIARGITGHSYKKALYSIAVAYCGPAKPVPEQRENCRPSSRESREAMPGGMGWPW